ncbi:hypothetical protein OAG69_00180 [bacterium]|nr:hypothetical protein [bacterium]
MTLIAIAVLIVAILIFMISRSNRQHLGNKKGAQGTEEPWALDSESTPFELSPCDPTNAKRGASLAWLETNSDLAIKDGAASDGNWTLSGEDLKPN